MTTVRTVQFRSAFDVHVETTPAHPPPECDNVLVSTKVTAVSTGTELLVYRGEVPTDMPTDAIFPTQLGPITYPLAYGYSAVGVVQAVGPEVRAFKPGDLVFAFREHTSAFVAPASELQYVPDGIDPDDAVFLPNIETAISLAMDASPFPGDVICVVGQGIVGLLFVAALKHFYPFCRVIALDIDEQRRRISHENAGADVALDPKAEDFYGKFLWATQNHQGADVSVDVTGVGEGLDVAIRATRKYGRVVIGSWYGRKDVTLAYLGGHFHRSHIQSVASHVSEIPALFNTRWTKKRRFELAWKLIATMTPSKRFPVKRFDVDDAWTAYKELANGEHVQVFFEYGNS